MKRSYTITSESVTEGHPDKICDIISDAILDNLIGQDPDSRVAIECLATTGTVHVAGEVSTAGWADVQKIVRETLREIGYTNHKFGIDSESAGVWVSIHSQSPDISRGITAGKGEDNEQGAGDQGMMYGYSVDETAVLMPLPIMLAHQLTMKLAEVRKRGVIEEIGPDGKSQVTILYENDKPIKVTDVVIAQQHTDAISTEDLRIQILEHVVNPVCGQYSNKNTIVHINATGRFVTGGPEGDTGVTGRKIIVDTYGGAGRHGGGCFSGKDPSKVDRSGAYMARYVAKNIVAAGLARRCEVQLSYVIGIAQPTNVNVWCFGTEKRSEKEIQDAVRKVFDFRPKAIIDVLNLRRPIYKKTASYGHFGRDDPDFTWEKTDKVEELQRAAGCDS
ncbi:MAG: methionine adenosyltransferase [Candidatus Scalindua sp.]|nr:methionine adenosyltransferase [Candidatus Scalindua sp.]